MRRSRLGPLVVLLAVSGAACNGSTSADPSPAPSPTAAAASPSPSPAPSPSPTEVLPANDVDDPVAALEAIVAYRDHLFENPDPDKLKLIYAERCDCYERVRTVLAEASAQGSHVEFSTDRAFEVVEMEAREGPFAQIRYRVSEPAARSVDASGQVLEERDESEKPSEFVAVLVREGGRWVVVALV